MYITFEMVHNLISTMVYMYNIWDIINKVNIDNSNNHWMFYYFDFQILSAQLESTFDLYRGRLAGITIM